MLAVAEAELGALYINARMGHKQGHIQLQTDNSKADGVINNHIQPKRTKSIDMRFHWLQCRESQNQFRIFWGAGRMNWANY